MKISTLSKLSCTLVFVFLALVPATHAQANLPRTISVRGEATVSAPPDTAAINTGVVTTAPTAQQALDSNNADVRALLRVLSMQGIAEADIQTSFFSINPRFSRNNDGSQGEITGYQVSNDLRVIVRDLDNLGKVLDALVDAGSNSISGVNFSIEDDKALVNRAMRLAVKDAMRRARVLASAAGVELGMLVAISEQPVSVPSSTTFAAAESSVPVAPGTLDVTATVFLQFMIV